MTGAVRTRTRPLLVLLFAAYLVVLVWLVVWKLHTPFIADGTGTIKLIPFVRTADAGSSSPREVLGNIGVFVPFGVYFGLLGRRWWTSLAVIALTSAALEATQFVLGVGVTDITDVITNTTGGALGLLLAGLVGRRAGAALCVVGTTIAAVALLAYLAEPMRPISPL
ncbi:VanZ family protein [Microbacterium sp.]|uniref:VanZ family protein n=1 Tax=Microbacterium sp. TaxID=51671 RepID=UPI003F6FDC7F